MKSIFLKELNEYSKEHILELVDKDSFSKLMEYEIIKRDSNSFKFNFVGIIIVDGYILKIYPKYIPKEKFRENDFNQILKVLKKYQNQNDDLSYETDNLEDISFNILSMMLFFIEDYYKNGLYTNEKKILEVNGSGEIDWNRTINHVNPIIKDSRPYYGELYTGNKISDIYDFFRMLHEYIITDCSKKLEEYGLLELFDLTPVELTSKSPDDFGEIEFVLEKLEKELNVEFNSQKQKLLKSMHAYLSHKNSFTNENLLTIYGTTSYHVVWEEICAKVFGDKLHKRLGDLKINLDENLNPKDKLIDLIEKPVWYYKNIVPKKADGGFIPDTVTFFRGNFVILDAKYYKLRFNEKVLSGQPGLESIIKQYMYELAFREFIKSHFNGVKNAFLFPKYDGEIENRGHVKLDILSDLNLEEIQVIMLPAGEMNELYLNNKRIDISSLNL